ncbi:hypothetical protein GGR53DRAFT_504291, partial [Hypoxylon sp. FL1150]
MTFEELLWRQQQQEPKETTSPAFQAPVDNTQGADVPQRQPWRSFSPTHQHHVEDGLIWVPRPTHEEQKHQQAVASTDNSQTRLPPRPQTSLRQQLEETRRQRLERRQRDPESKSRAQREKNASGRAQAAVQWLNWRIEELKRRPSGVRERKIEQPTTSQQIGTSDTTEPSRAPGNAEGEGKEEEPLPADFYLEAQRQQGQPQQRPQEAGWTATEKTKEKPWEEGPLMGFARLCGFVVCATALVSLIVFFVVYIVVI